MDALYLAAVAAQLREHLIGARVQRVVQPEREEVHLVLRMPSGEERLLLSAHPATARVHLTSQAKRAPRVPPLFCMVLRKHLEGGRLEELAQPPFERILHLIFRSRDELGDEVRVRLTAELLGRQANLILTDPSGKILDALRRQPPGDGGRRELVPGRPYVAPAPFSRPTPDRITPAELAEAVRSGDTPLWKALLGACAGLSPWMAREVAFRAGCDPLSPAAAASSSDLERLAASAREAARWFAGPFSPTQVYGPDGFLAAVAPSYPPQAPCRTMADPSELADAFYGVRDEAERTDAQRAELAKVVSRAMRRCRHKLALQEESLRVAEGAEELRHRGELLTANLHLLRPGMRSIRLPDYTRPDEPPVDIELDPTRSPAANVQALFRRYKKAKSTQVLAAVQRDRTLEESAYLSTVAEGLAAAENPADLADIRQELIGQGYLRAGPRPAAAVDPARPARFRSSEGFEIWVGKNNRQNDRLTMQLAHPEDLWFHVKNQPGSHCLVRCQAGRVPGPRTLEEAALLAAYHSAARQGSHVDVDYTLRRHVKKPPGSKPGYVTYTHQRTLQVTPEAAAIQRLSREG
ncbi:MAG: NFACT family protein [Thermaerobacter sp.]|nr:NFACT family protein [Thermaerobacter sp.]